MKLRVTVLPVLVLLAFVYSNNVALRATSHGDYKLTKAAALAEVKADLAKFHPSTTFYMNGK